MGSQDNEDQFSDDLGDYWCGRAATNEDVNVHTIDRHTYDCSSANRTILICNQDISEIQI